MRRHIAQALAIAMLGLVATGSPSAAAEPLRVVTTLTVYASIANELVDPGSEVTSIATARQDAHFVQAKPSYSVRLGKADLLVGTGLDLELWLPAVVDKSRNSQVRPGAPGYVAVAEGMPMLEVVQNPTRAGGDIHMYGNPHGHTDPLRSVVIADNIRVGLQRVDSANAAVYQQRFEGFKERIHRRMFGDTLVDLVGGDKLAQLEMAGRLLPFLEATTIGGAPLSERLGGWMQQASCLRGTQIVPFHANWAYLFDRFGIEPAGYVERRPGIPPSASHVAEIVELMRRDEIHALWVADYFDRRVPELIAERTGAELLYVPMYPDPSGAGAATDVFGLYDLWIESLRAVTPACGA